MIFDDTTSGIVVDIARKNEITLAQTSKIIQGYFLAVNYTMAHKPVGVIKLDYFGKFIYSNAWKKKMDEIGKQIREKENV